MPGPPPLPGDAPLAVDDVDHDASPERAAFQITEQTRTYPCRQCGDQLLFSIELQKLACPSCGFEAEIDTSDLAAPTERDLRSTMGQLRSLVGLERLKVEQEHAEQLALGACRVRQGPEKVEDRPGTEFDPGRPYMAHCRMMIRRKHETNAGFPDAG